MDAQQIIKIEVEILNDGPHTNLCTSTTRLHDSFNYLEGGPHCLMASQDSQAIRRTDRNRQMHNDIESGAGTCEDGPYSRTSTKPTDDSWENFCAETTSPTPAISDSATCDLCFGQFNDELTLKHHITSVHNIASNIVILNAVSLKCSKCDFEAISREDLRKHGLLHAKKFACDLCGCRFFTNSRLKTHLKAHVTKNIYAFNPKSSFLEGLLNKPYKSCPICNFKTIYPIDLKVHLKTHTGERSFQCDLCNYKSWNKSTLILHIRKHTGEKPYHCNLCAFKATRKDGLTIHMTTHTGEKPFHCYLCDYKCSRKFSLGLHIRTHTGDEPLHCNSEFKTPQKGALTEHLRTLNSEKHCDLCDFKTLDSYYLKVHLKIKHPGKKPFHCDFCGYKCSKKTNLIFHIRTHTGEKPFLCNLCDFKSAQKGQLTTHLRTHSGERPFHCDVCDFKASKKSRLTEHLRTHTGEKPFHCSLCNFKAARKNSLTKHLRTHAGGRKAISLLSL